MILKESDSMIVLLKSTPVSEGLLVTNNLSSWEQENKQIRTSVAKKP
jgi:hypothetical protein